MDTFIPFLLESSKEQTRAILYTLNRNQTNYLGEMIINILEHKKELRKKVFKLADPKTRWHTRRRLIQKHMRIVVNLLRDCKTLLKELFCCDEEVYSDSLEPISEDDESGGGGGGGEGTSNETRGEW